MKSIPCEIIEEVVGLRHHFVDADRIELIAIDIGELVISQVS